MDYDSLRLWSKDFTSLVPETADDVLGDVYGFMDNKVLFGTRRNDLSVVLAIINTGGQRGHGISTSRRM